MNGDYHIYANTKKKNSPADKQKSEEQNIIFNLSVEFILENQNT
jgi:hypothetical protein